jgi:predicted homoserine dehydrogenase-like protein
MILVDTALKRRAQENRPIQCGVFGAGFMARGLTNQGRYLTGITFSAVCNRSLDAALAMCADAKMTDITVVTTGKELDAVIRRGGTAVTTEPLALCESELLECLVEATGHVEYGALVTTMAIEHRKHMVLMNAELDGTVGSILSHRAKQAGVVLTGCDGDQPGVEINLLRFVESIGMTPRVCGNIKGMQDRYRNPTTQESFAKQWGQTASMVTSFADGTKISFEQAIVANATGMVVAQRGMIGIEHKGPVDDLTNSYDLDMLREVGGIVDYVVGSLPSPGVFVFAEAQDTVQAHYLNYGKLGNGPLYSFYVPYHLTIFEVPLTVVRAVEFGDAAIMPIAGPVVDVVTAAKTDLRAGQVLDGLGWYNTYGLCENHSTVRTERLLPMGLAEGCTLLRDIHKDEVITYDDVARPAVSLVHDLRAEQDRLFAPA